MDKVLSLLKERPWLIAVAVVIGLILMRGGKSGGGGYNYEAMLQSQSIAADTNIAMAQIGSERVAAQNAVMADYLKTVSLGAMAASMADREQSTKLAMAGMQAGQAAAEANAMFSLGAMQQQYGFATALKSLGIQERALEGDYLLASQQIGLERHALDVGRYAGDRQLEVERRFIDITNEMDARYINQALPQILRNNIDAIWHQGRAQRNIVKAAGTTSILNNLISTAGSLASQGMYQGRF